VIFILFHKVYGKFEWTGPRTISPSKAQAVDENFSPCYFWWCWPFRNYKCYYIIAASILCKDSTLPYSPPSQWMNRIENFFYQVSSCARSEYCLGTSCLRRNTLSKFAVTDTHSFYFENDSYTVNSSAFMESFRALFWSGHDPATFRFAA
jgi:hypothetical protein